MLTVDEANAKVLANLTLADRIARRWVKRARDFYPGAEKEFDDLRQMALVGMLNAARLEKTEQISDREYLGREAGRFISRTLNRERWVLREKNSYINVGDYKEDFPLVERARCRKTKRPVDILTDKEWWELATGHLSGQEREYVRLRIEESKDLRATADEMGLSPYDARLLEKSVMTSCGKTIRRRLKTAVKLPFDIDVPRFMERPNDIKNGRAVVDVGTGRVYPTLSALAREIGCTAADINHAIKRKGGKFERWQFRHATDEDRDLVRLEESKKSVTVRKDYRSRGVVEVVSGRFFHSILKAAKETSVPQPTLYKSLSVGSGRINGYLFRFATEHENESNICLPPHTQVTAEGFKATPSD